MYSEEQLSYHFGGPKTIDMLYNPKDVLNWLQEYDCVVKHFFFGEQIREEGILHTGTGHVIQGIVKKV